MVGFNLQTGEDIARKDYEEQLERPLRDFLASRHLLVLERDPASTNGALKLTEDRIRYVVLCFGVPLRIGNEPGLERAGGTKIDEGFAQQRRGRGFGLCLLPWPVHHMLTGFISNPCYGVTNPGNDRPPQGGADGDPPGRARGGSGQSSC